MLLPFPVDCHLLRLDRPDRSWIIPRKVASVQKTIGRLAFQVRDRDGPRAEDDVNSQGLQLTSDLVGIRLQDSGLSFFQPTLLWVTYRAKKCLALRVESQYSVKGPTGTTSIDWFSSAFAMKYPRPDHFVTSLASAGC